MTMKLFCCVLEPPLSSSVPVLNKKVYFFKKNEIYIIHSIFENNWYLYILCVLFGQKQLNNYLFHWTVNKNSTS